MGRTVGCRVPGTIARIAGAELTHPLDCNVYVVYGREEALLVDTASAARLWRSRAKSRPSL